MPAASKMTAARTQLVLDNPFFGALVLHLKMVEDKTAKTAWVNGRELGYNPVWIGKLSADETKALLAHEVMHCAMGHPWRRDGRNFKRFNIACDKAINHTLRDSGFKVPESGCFAEGDEIGKSAEWIYGRMQQQGEEQPQPDQDQDSEEQDQDGDGEGQQGDGEEPGDSDGNGNGKGQPDEQGEVRDAPTETDKDGEPAPTEQDWKQHIAVAATQAKMMGKMPGGLARAVQEALKPKVDVKSLLLRFFSERSNGDYSWRQPNVRYIARGLYLPSLNSETLGEVAIMIDTSGSMDDIALAEARTVVEQVLDECDPAAITLYFADTEVARVTRLEKGEPLTWEPGGGGGTDFRAALKQIEEDGSPVCVICITDLYGTFPDPENEPRLPVMWLCTSTHEPAPFGETVYCNE